MDRRQFLQYSGALTATLFLENVFGEAVPLKELQQLLGPQDATILTPQSADFSKYQWAYNQRTALIPSVRVLCRTEKAVSESILWAQAQNVPVAMRCGGHSYEGFSQSKGLVIDLRLMNEVSLSNDKKIVSVGGGGRLGEVYEALAPHKLALPAGTCPTVGISGHTTGGGYGLLARPLGLACDSLVEIELIDTNGKKLVANAQENSDLLWAYRGGGGGSFGVITKLHYKTHPVDNVTVFGFGWTVDQKAAVKLIQGWLQWAPALPSNITSLLSLSKNKDGSFQLKCKGQTVGSVHELEKAIAALQSIKKAEGTNIKTMKFIEAAHYFAGGDEGAPKFRKVKCDYLTEVMSDEGIKILLEQFPVGRLSITMDSYGGAISQAGPEDGAFFHRAGTLCSVKFSTNWTNPNETAERLAQLKKYHDKLRPYFSGGSYVNYCDLDLENYGEAYWGSNFARLKQIKKIYDPKNFFRHAQSIPVE